MRTNESPFEHYMSEWILPFDYLMCPLVSGPKALKKTCLRFAIFNLSEKLPNIFELGLKKFWSIRTIIALIEKYFDRKKFADNLFVVYTLIYPLSKFGVNQTNFPWALVFYSVRFKWKIEKTALNMSIRQVIFFFRPKLKTAISLPIFNFFSDFFFRLEIVFGSLH